ncbi:hypothetical protein G6011_05891 [Alternaria panax]|uniref:Uncharacterized protein n=1 Tax=Alternaria panax TaxID=48097 RepID=A0AAD4FFH6_9PLEO|nr:hypothetical protein G6011_05891 [Alternaria panax]
MSTRNVRELLGLSEQQWPIFLRVSLEVCKDFTRAKLKDLTPGEKEYLIQKIRESVQEEGLPALDDGGIEWRLSKVLPELRFYQRFADQYEAWEKLAGTTFPNRVLREAHDVNLSKIRAKGFRYWTQIPEKIRIGVAKEANRRLVASGLPTMDEEALLYRLRKHVNHWIRDGRESEVRQEPSKTEHD